MSSLLSRLMGRAGPPGCAGRRAGLQGVPHGGR